MSIESDVISNPQSVRQEEKSQMIRLPKTLDMYDLPTNITDNFEQHPFIMVYANATNPNNYAKQIALWKNPSNPMALYGEATPFVLNSSNNRIIFYMVFQRSSATGFNIIHLHNETSSKQYIQVRLLDNYFI